MTRVTLALGSFIVGVCSTCFMLSLIQTSTRVQAQGGLLVEGAEPVVPAPRFHSSGGEISGAVQPLDGIDCAKCVITSPVFTYGGGAFSCTDCTLKTGSLQLKGAAMNTFLLLKFFGAIPAPKPAPNSQPNPNIKRAEMQIMGRETFTLVAMDGVKK